MSLITRKIKAGEIGLPMWAKKALEERGLKENEVEVFRKGISPEDTKINQNERSTIDYITTKVVDRDGDIVVPSGAILDHYRKNPVVLFGHDYRSLPIGKSLWIKADDKGLISKTQYAKHQKAEDIYQYRKDGFPMAKSIGFIPLKVIGKDEFDELDDKYIESLGLTKDDISGADRIYPEWLMLEYSDVPVPSNPEALQLAISKGIITQEEVDEADERKAIVLDIIEEEKSQPESEEIVLKPETTDNYHHIPVRSAGDFVDGSFKTITLSADQGIKAVIGKLKSDPDGSTKIQKYLFDVSKWTMEEARSWVNDHKDAEAEDRKNMLDKRYGDDVIIELGDSIVGIDNSKADDTDCIDKEPDNNEDEVKTEESDGISQEDEFDSKNALISILETLKEHGKAIEELKSYTKPLPFTYIEGQPAETGEKAGRVLSKKTRSIISDALLAMDKAAVALNELIENSDSNENEQVLDPEDNSNEEEKASDEIVVNIKDEEKINLINIDEEKLKSSITQAIGEILSNTKVSVGDMVKERLDRRNGKIF